ncbi:MAG: phosphodiester glycosidase family protein [Clostridia bacterium]|nr:phosphodiester glycosidase family protein [Clostridia bacterium]
MKKSLLLVLIFTILLPLAPRSFSKETVWQQNTNIVFSGGKRTVNAIYINMNDKTLRMESVIAKNQVGQVDDLKNIAGQAKSANRQVIGAINGTFFNAYSDFQPEGTIQTKGQVAHIGQTGSVIAFSADNSVIVENLYTYISGSINGSYEYPNNWYAWGFNHKYDSKDSTIVFTPAFGKSTGTHNKTSITVSRGTVTKISSAEASIPADGFTIVTGDSSLTKRFAVGDKVNYKLEYFKSVNGKKGTALNWDNIRTTVGAGPTLVKNGIILADGKAEGFSENKINKNRAQRSFAGITKNNILVLGTVSSVTVKELAEIVRKLGIVNAINLDGGASSGLFFKDRYVTTPGRKLSNALVITKLKEMPVRVKLNNKDIFYSHDPYLTGSNTVMVPLVQAFKDFDSFPASDSSKNNIIFRRYGKIYEFKPGSTLVKIDGIPQQLTNSIETHDGQNFIPLQFIADFLGGKLTWDNSGRTADISADMVKTDDIYIKANKAMDNKDFSTSKELYLKILKLEPRHAGALLKLAALSTAEKEYELAIECYTAYLAIRPNDLDILNKLGWAYYNNGNLASSIDTFKKLIGKKPDSAAYWMSLGSIYTHYSLKQYEEAKQCYEKALTLSPTKEQKQLIDKQLDFINEKLNQ